MLRIDQNYPHPFLAEDRDDYSSECSFRTLFNQEAIVIDNENINIPIEYELKCQGLEKLLSNKQIAPVIKIYSPEASYTRIFHFPEGKTKVTVQIPKYDVIRQLEITGLLIAQEPIQGFTCEEFNPIYFGKVVFNIRKGDILAGEPIRCIYLDASEYEKPLSSIFSIKPDFEARFGIKSFFGNDKIEVYLNENLYNLYNQYNAFKLEEQIRYFNGVIIFPTLVEALNKMREEILISAGSYSRTSLWFRSIEEKLKKIYPELAQLNSESDDDNLSPYEEELVQILEESTKTANLLLGDISVRAMEGLEAIWKDLADTDEAIYNE